MSKRKPFAKHYKASFPNDRALHKSQEKSETPEPPNLQTPEERHAADILYFTWSTALSAVRAVRHKE